MNRISCRYALGQLLIYVVSGAAAARDGVRRHYGLAERRLFYEDVPVVT